MRYLVSHGTCSIGSNLKYNFSGKLKSCFLPSKNGTMKKVFLLNNCGTCQRIMDKLCELPGFERQNIKEQNISAEVLDWLKEKVGGYEVLFSKQAMKYKSLGLKDKKLTELDYCNYILEEYTFLKRPVIIDGEEIWVGNAPKTVEAAKSKLIVDN